MADVKNSFVPGCTVLRPGLLTTVQDSGRFGYRHYGIPPAGPLDVFAFTAANCLVGNEKAAAALEVTGRGPALRLLGPALIAATGADLGMRLNGRPAATWQAHYVAAGSIIDFSGPRRGWRAYVAFHGGIATRVVLGSRATYTRARLGGRDGRPLQTGDVLPFGRPTVHTAAQPGPGLALPSAWRRFGEPRPVRIVWGPQGEAFSPLAFSRLSASPYRVTAAADRMGYKLRGLPLPYRHTVNHVSDGVVPGSVQVPPDGQPIVLLADGPTTGGYPKIATVIAADRDCFAQAAPGDVVTFRAVSRQEALTIRRRRGQLLGAIEHYTRRHYRQEGKT